MDKKSLLYGGLSLSLGIGAAVSYFLSQQKGEDHVTVPLPRKKIERSTCLAILKEISRKLFQVFSNLAVTSRKTRGIMKDKLSDEEFKDALLNHSKITLQPPIIILIRQAS